MASLWIQHRKQAEQKIAGRMSGGEALRRLRQLWQKWQTQNGCTALEGADGYIQLLEGNAIVGIAWVEHLSPPSQPEPGQPLRKRGMA
jgi:hypothetical protein